MPGLMCLPELTKICQSYVLDPTLLQIWYLFKVKKNVENMTQAMNRLIARRNTIEKRIADAERRQETCIEEEVENWREEVKQIEVKVTSIQAKYREMCFCLEGCPLNCWTGYRIGKRAFMKISELDTLWSRGSFQVVATKPPPGVGQDIWITPTPIGTKMNLDKVRDYLADSRVGILGIWGTGGVGKSTLLQCINNYYLRSAEFHHVIWVEVTKEHNLESLQKDIAEKLGLSFEKDAESQKRAIFNYLRSRNFLLILDNLWEAVNLNALGVPHPRSAVLNLRKRKVVFAARSEEVCGRMEAHKSMNVECLNPEDSWRLFEENVGNASINSDEAISRLAAEVAEECGGLPLALITVGQAMSSKTSVEDWRYALETLKNPVPSIPGMEDPMLPTLKFSYNNLQYEKEKMCFLCCSLWPGNCSIKKDELVETWMGLGLIDERIFADINNAYDRGHFLIGRLKAACLLEPAYGDQNQVRMHQRLRSLALRIASIEHRWMVRAGDGLKEVPEEAQWRLAKIISLMHNEIETLPQIPLDCPNLTTLILRGNLSLKTIPPNFFKSMPALTYLDLSETDISALPREIGKVRKLQYLDLSKTKIESLPVELGNLVELKYLLLHKTMYLRKIPAGTLPILSKLRVLDLSGSGYAYSSGLGGSAEQKKGIASIKELGCLKGALGITIYSLTALSWLSRSSRVSTKRLWMTGPLGSSGVPLHLLSPDLLGSPNIRKTLKELRIMHNDCYEELVMGSDVATEEENQPPSGRDFCFPMLELLHLWSLTKLKEIKWNGLMAHKLVPTLRELTIFKCDKLKDVSWVLTLPHLECLSLSNCDEMESVVGGAEDSYGEDIIEAEGIVPSFPRLKTLVLEDLPMLSSISNRALAFPCLESLHVSRRRREPVQLKKLPFGQEITGSLKKIEGEKEWWQGLQWDGDNMKSLLLPYFVAIIPPPPHPPPRPPRPSPPIRRVVMLGRFFYRAIVVLSAIPFLFLLSSTAIPPSLLCFCFSVFLVFRGGCWGNGAGENNF